MATETVETVARQGVKRSCPDPCLARLVSERSELPIIGPLNASRKQCYEVGRNPAGQGVDFHIDHPLKPNMISRVHAKILFKQATDSNEIDQWAIVDLSSNGECEQSGSTPVSDALATTLCFRLS